MVELSLDGARNVLCLGAHADDIEIGCGGTMLKLASGRSDLNVMWVVFGAQGKRRREALEGARRFLKHVRRKKVVLKPYRDSFFPFHAERIKEYFERLKRSFQPDIVFTHYRDDRHQDHRVLSDLAWNTFRHHLILEYEIPKYDGDMGSPNVFVRLDEETAGRKVAYVCAAFQTQANRHWFEKDTFLGLMRLRGMECACPTRYAEAFYCRKLVVA
jgi:LmbE family N-acetylglucosaminyl deacetylase